MQEGEEEHGAPLHGRTALGAVVLVLVLLLSTVVVSITDSLGTSSNHVVGDNARTASIVPGTTTLVVNPIYVLTNQTITFYANSSSDDPGAILTFTIFYDCLDSTPTVNPEGPVTVDNIGSPWSLERTFSYNHPGNLTQSTFHYFWVALFVSDGTDNISKTTQVFVDLPPVNQPPVFLSNAGDSNNVLAGVPFTVRVKIADKEGDNVTIFWEFGDGTNATNLTVNTKKGVYANQTHTWNPRIPGGGGNPGDFYIDYLLNVSLSDALHPPVTNSTIMHTKVFANSRPHILNDEVRSSKSAANTGEPVNFTIAASDPEGDPLTWTFNYSDGTVVVYHTNYTAPNVLIWNNATHSFTIPGMFIVNVSVSDALVPFQVGDHNLTAWTTVTITSNVPPYLSTTFAINPADPIINSTAGFVNATVSIDAFDSDGDMFNLTWDLGVLGIRTNASEGDAAQRMSSHTFSQVLTFNKTGSYTIVVTVSDGRPGHDVQRTKVVNVSSNNRRPVILEFQQTYLRGYDFALRNETVNFTLIFTDWERDPVNLTWNFGDGSPKVPMYLTDYDASGNITVHVNHSYAKLGYYNVTIILTDNKIGGFNHTLNATLKVFVSVPRVIVTTNWDWWDFTSLAMVMMIPIGSVAWVIMLRRQRKHIEDQGMTYDEWKIMKEIDSKGLSK